MAIKIIDDAADIYLTRAEHERLQREWRDSQQYTTRPESFETWVRSRQHRAMHMVRQAELAERVTG